MVPIVNIFNFKIILVNENIHIMCKLQIIIVYQYNTIVNYKEYKAPTDL